MGYHIERFRNSGVDDVVGVDTVVQLLFGWVSLP